MIVKGKLQTWGNSYGIRISKKIARELKLVREAPIIIRLEQQRTDGFGMCHRAGPLARDPSDDRGW